jgi:hypothetical protein
MRFLVWAELVEDGEEGGVLDLARGGFHRWRLKSLVRPGFGVGRKSSGGGRNWRPGFVGSFYRAPWPASSRLRSRRSCQRRGKDGHDVALSSMRAGEDEDELVPIFWDEGVTGCLWAVVLGC